MDTHTINETFEYRIKHIVLKLLKNYGTDLADFKTDDELLDFIYNDKQLSETLGKYLLDDIAECTDGWLDILNTPS